jgi:ribose 5-phosphate isomerase B
MIIYLGADHRGFKLKEILKKKLTDEGYLVMDMGAEAYNESDDFPDFAKAVAHNVADHPDTRGIVICGGGFGVDIAANKIPGVRAALAMSPEHVVAGRHDDDVNVLALASDFTKEPKALAIVIKFLTTEFGNEERYKRRINKIG